MRLLVGFGSAGTRDREASQSMRRPRTRSSARACLRLATDAPRVECARSVVDGHQNHDEATHPVQWGEARERWARRDVRHVHLLWSHPNAQDLGCRNREARRKARVAGVADAGDDQRIPQSPPRRTPPRNALRRRP